MRATCKNHLHVRLHVSAGYERREGGHEYMSGPIHEYIGPNVAYTGIVCETYLSDLFGDYMDTRYADQPCSDCSYSDIVLLRD